MTAKQYLTRYLEINGEIETKKMRIYECRAKAVNISSSLSPCNVQSSHDNGKLAKIIDNYIDKEEELTERMGELQQIQFEIEETVDKYTSGKEKELLEWMYLKGLSLEDAAFKINYSYRQACRLHGCALEKIKRCPIMATNGNQCP